MTPEQPRQSKMWALLSILGLIVLGLLAFWDSGRVELTVTKENAPIFELDGKIVFKDEKTDKVVGRLKKGQKVTSSWYYYGKDILLYKVTHNGVTGYVMVGDVQPE